MSITEHFRTPVWLEKKPDWVKALNKDTDPYVAAAKKERKDEIKKLKDKFTSYHSRSLLRDSRFSNLRDYIGDKAWEFLDYQGFDMPLYTLFFSEMWVQEFAKNGGGYQAPHQHWQQVVSGFYFLKVSEKTSYPYFMDPRPGATMTKLRLKNGTDIFHGSELVHYKPKPGDLMIFPGYLTHGFATDYGLEPFRFIHFNIQAAPKEVIK